MRIFESAAFEPNRPESRFGKGFDLVQIRRLIDQLPIRKDRNVQFFNRVEDFVDRLLTGLCGLIPTKALPGVITSSGIAIISATRKPLCTSRTTFLIRVCRFFGLR